MPLFPVSMPSLPSFPSVSSMRALLDLEPQLFYPAPKSPSHRRRRDSSSSTRSTASGFSGNPTYPSGAASGSPVRRAPPGLGRPPPGSSGLGRLGAASHSAVDLSGWSKVENPLAELGRRNSLSSRPYDVTCIPSTPPRKSTSMETDRLPTLTHLSPSPSPSRRTHRRSQSALPTPGYTRPYSQIPAPRGRLVEFCRNPLASASAVSLPTLAEGEMEHLHSPVPEDETPVGHARLYRRPSTRTTITIPLPSNSSPSSPTSTSSLVGSFPSPLSLSFSLDSASFHSSSSEESDYFGPAAIILSEDLDETPRPTSKRRNSDNVLILSPTHSSSVPPPQRVAKLRPPTSPRAESHRLAPSQRGRTQSYGPGLSIPLSRSISTVSDVAVMATWSFPPSLERQMPGSDQPAATEGTQAGRGGLRERLRTLSMLDTSVAHIADDALSAEELMLYQSPAEIQGGSAPKPMVYAPTIDGQLPGPSHLQRGRLNHHRHTHSSPTSLPRPRALPPTHFRQPSRLVRGTLLFPDLPPSESGSIITSSSSSRSGSPGRPGGWHRRTTTPSRLRSPQLLSLPFASEEAGVTSQLRAARHRADSSRCGTTDDRGGPQLPPHPLARTRSAVDHPMAEGAKGRAWWRMRRSSIGGETMPALRDAVDAMQDRAHGFEEDVNQGKTRRRETSPEDERFIDYDDI